MTLKSIRIESWKPLWAYCEPNESDEWARGEILHLMRREPSKAHFAVGWDDAKTTVGVFRTKAKAHRFAEELGTVYPKVTEK